MAQHDYIISNQTFPNTRADINNVLQALATNNSGTTAPTTQYAGQFWLDTNTPSSTTWTLYIHDGSDDIAFATIDTSANTVNFTDSALDVVTDTTPQLGGNLDLNSNDITGTGNINITGSLTASGNLTSLGIDDNATSTAITIDSNEKLQVNTSGKTSYLNVNSAHDSGVSSFKTLRLGDTGLRQHWTLDNDNGTVAYFSTNGNSLIQNANANLMFYTNGSERMRITSTGLVGIGTSSPDDKLHVTDSSSAELKLQTDNANGGSAIKFNRSGTDNSYIGTKGYFTGTSDNNLYLRANSGLGVHFYTNGNNERMRIDSSGNVGIGTSSPLTELQVDASGGARFIVSRTGAGYLYTEGGDNPIIRTSVGSLIFQTAGENERMRIDDSGNVGIGTNSPSAKLHVDTSNSAVAPNTEADDFFVESSSNTGITIGSGISSRSSLYFANSTDNDIARIVVSHADGSMRFHNNASERMRIDSSGNVLVGKTTTGVSNVGGEMRNGINDYALLGTSSSEATLILNRTTTTGDIARFRYNNTGVGDISVTASATAYNTSSDYRLKENVSYDFDATTRLKQLKPARFNFIADADTTVDGFLAHEVSSVVPEAISGEKDAMRTEDYEVTPAVLDEDGNVITEAVMGTREVPDYQGIDQAKLVPLLVKTIQELEARITTLEANNP